MKFFTLPALAAAAVLSAVVVLPFLPIPKKTGGGLFALEVRMASSVAGRVQVYYPDSGGGLSEKDSSQMPLVQSSSATLYRLPLPAGSYSALRFDPLDREGTVAIESLRIVAPDGRVVRPIAFSEIQPANQIGSLHERSGRLEVTTSPGGDDPQVAITLTPGGAELRETLPGRYDGFWLHALSVFAAVAGLLFILDRVPRTRVLPAANPEAPATAEGSSREKTTSVTQTSAVVRRMDVFLTVLALGLVVWFYHWTVRSSGGFNPPGEEDYYNFLIQGWRQGHLYMSKAPRPEMLALTDPYDPVQNHDFRLADASYFRGHNYLYFGAAPAAVLMLPYALITGHEMGTTTAIYVFCVAGFLAASCLWLAIRHRYFPSSAPWVAPLGVLLLGLGTHVLALARRPLVWELPISAGFAFSMLALLGVYVSLHCKKPVWAMGAAGLSLGLAVASRPTCLLGTVMFLPAIWQMRRMNPASLWRRCGVAASVGLGVCLLAIMIHNFARFGNALEFGQNYQLTSVYESKMRHFSGRYIAHNFYIYYLHPGGWTRVFPFVSASAVSGGPPGYLGAWSEPVCGLATTFPFLWVALALPLVWRKQSVQDEGSFRTILIAVFLFYLTASGAILGYFLATPRYMADFTPALALLAACGWLVLERWSQRARLNVIIGPLIAITCFATAIIGVLVSCDYHGRLLRTLSRSDWEKIERNFRSFF